MKPDKNIMQKYNLNFSSSTCIFFSEVTEQEVVNIVNRFKASNSVDIYGISNNILK